MKESEEVGQLIKEGYTVCIARGTDLDYNGDLLTYRVFVLNPSGEEVAEAQSHDLSEAMCDAYTDTPEASPLDFEDETSG